VIRDLIETAKRDPLSVLAIVISLVSLVVGMGGAGEPAGEGVAGAVGIEAGIGGREVNRYRFVFERGEREAEGEDVVEALTEVMKEIDLGPGIVSTKLGWLESFTEKKVVKK